MLGLSPLIPGLFEILPVRVWKLYAFDLHDYTR